MVRDGTLNTKFLTLTWSYFIMYTLQRKYFFHGFLIKQVGMYVLAAYPTN